MYIEALEPLLHECPSNILKYILGQFSKVILYYNIYRINKTRR
jgi:hypothetical protein